MSYYKGIVLAGGAGSRLHPITLGVSKQLLPVYDKPLIYYPLSVLMLAGIREILVISTPEDLGNFKALLGDGSQFGIKIEYAEQVEPRGIPDAFIIAEDFIGDDCCCLILGDNLFYGQYFTDKLKLAMQKEKGATIFCHHVTDPERFGVVTLTENNQISSIEEKPSTPRSNFAITGIYFCDNKAVAFAKEIKPSSRGELEITDVLQCYLTNDELSVQVLGRGFAWLDTGTHDSLIKAGQFVQTIEARQGLKIACLEEIAYRNGRITLEQLKEQYEMFKHASYGEYLLKIIVEESLS
jgi:glucose-1-phosphate thymidylyltransferase